MRTVLLAAGVLAALTSAPAQTPAAKPADPLGGFKTVATDYKLKLLTASPEFPVKTRAGKIDGKAAADDELAAYAPLFVTEFTLYPTQLVKKTKLARVVFCTDLSFAGQKRTAIPDAENATLYLDVVRGAPNTAYQRLVLHHEFFHVIDLADDGALYEDKAWAKLNPADFKYGSGGVNAQDDSKTAVPVEKVPGFLNHYSTTGVEEDKAEVFAYLMADPDYLDGRAKKDEVLAAKAKRMRKLVGDFCKQADDKFWKAAAEADRGKK